jgi:hypothetical protein
MAYILPITAVGDAVFALFQDAALQALVPGGVQTDVPPTPQFPFLLFSVVHDANYGGLGTKPGRGSMPGLTLRLHVFQGRYGTRRDGEIIMTRALQLLFPSDDSVPLVIDGYTLCSGQPLPEPETLEWLLEELNGVKVWELPTNINLIVEETAE